MDIAKTISGLDQTKKIAIALICIVVVIFLFSFASSKQDKINDYNDFMYGYWVGDNTFCESAKVSSMLLFIGKPKSSGCSVSRDAYLIINNDVTNQPIVLKYNNPSILSADIRNRDQKIKVDADDDDNDDTDQKTKSVSIFSTEVIRIPTTVVYTNPDEVIMPDKITMEFDIRRGMLRMFDSKTIYAVYYKENEITDIYRMGS
jgi:hypothetical protein